MINLSTLIAIDTALMNARLDRERLESDYQRHERMAREASDLREAEDARIDELSQHVDPARECGDFAPVGFKGSGVGSHHCNRTTTHNGFHAKTDGPRIIATW